MKNPVKYKILMIPVLFLLSGCSANGVNPGAKLVRVTNTEPQNCEFLGDVTGNQGNYLTGGWTSNSNLETGARNDLKNKAHEMGGNVVAVITQRAGQTGSAFGGTGSSEQTNVTLSGNVYRCPD